jgi:putative transposase
MESNFEHVDVLPAAASQHHKHLKSTNLLERQMEEIKWRTLVVRIFPTASEQAVARST